MKTMKFLLIFLIVGSFQIVLGQNTPQQQNANQTEVIDLGQTEVKVKIETPQVQLLTKRITPEFDDVKIDRSFKKELIGEDEKISLKQRSESTEYVRINIDQLMKTLR